MKSSLISMLVACLAPVFLTATALPSPKPPRVEKIAPRWHMAGDYRGIGIQFTGGAKSTGVSIRLHWVLPENAEVGRDSAADRLQGVFPGIDVLLHGLQGVPEFDFLVAPHFSPHAIAYRFDEASRVALLPNGALSVETNGLCFTQRKPLAWQTVGGRRQPVEVSFEPQPNGRIGFRVGDYREDLPLVIDPTVEFSTYLAGDASDSFRPISVAKSPSGDLFVLGYGGESSLPTIGNAAKPYPDKLTSLVLARIDGTSYQLLSRTFLPMDTYASPRYAGPLLTIDSNGSPWISMISTRNLIPTLNDPIGTVPSGTAPAYERTFLLRLNPEANSVTYSTYAICQGALATQSMVAGTNNDLVLGGSARCAQFPTTAGAFEESGENTGKEHGFILKLDATSGNIQYGTYFGTTEANYYGGASVRVAVDSTGRVIVGANVRADQFPVTTDSYMPARPGNQSIYLGVLSADGSSLDFGTYFGGTGDTTLQHVKAGPGDSVYFAGDVITGTIPLSAGAFSAAQAGSPSQFISRISKDGKRLESSAIPYRGYSSLAGLSVLPDGDAAFAVYGAWEQVAMSHGAFSAYVPNRASTSFLIGRLSADGTTLRFASEYPATKSLASDVMTGGGGMVFVSGRAQKGAVVQTEGAFPAPTNVGPEERIGFLIALDLDSPTYCSYAAHASPVRFPPNTSAGSIEVSTQPGCPWVAHQVGNIIIEWGEQTGRVGSGSISLKVPANPKQSERSVEIMAGSTTFHLMQNPGTCDVFEVYPAELTFSAPGESYNARVLTPEGCEWTGGPSTAWFTDLGIFGQHSPSYVISGSRSFSAWAFPNSFEARSGVLPLGPRQVPVTQAAGSCTSSVAPPSLQVPRAGGDFTLNLKTTGTDCAWQYSTGPGVHSPFGTNGKDDAAVQIRIDPNPSNTVRESYFILANKRIPITQDAGICTAAFASQALEVPHVGGDRRINFTASGDACQWNATTSAPWISFGNNESTGTGALVLKVEPNPSSAPRQAIIQNLGASASITQLGNDTAYVRLSGGWEWPITVNGQVGRMPYEATWPVGTELSIEAGEFRFVDETTVLITNRWSDGAPRNRSLVLSSNDTQLSLDTETIRRISEEKVDGGAVNVEFLATPVDGWPEFFRQTDMGPLAFWATAVPDPGYRFVGWVQDTSYIYRANPQRSFADGLRWFLRPRFEPENPPAGARVVPSALEFTVYPEGPETETMLELRGVDPSQVLSVPEIICDTNTALFRIAGGNSDGISYKTRLRALHEEMKVAGNGSYHCTARIGHSNSESGVVAQITVHVKGISASNPPVSNGIRGISNAATFAGGSLSPGGLFSAFGTGLADGTKNPDSLPLPLLLAGAQIRIYSEVDYAERYAELLYVSPLQINFFVPDDVPVGAAQVRLYRSGTLLSSTPKYVAQSAAGVFFVPILNSSPAPAGYAVLVANGAQFVRDIYRCPAGQSGCNLEPLDFGGENDEVFLSIYGTGLRHLQKSKLHFFANGTEIPVDYLGAHRDFVGLDQVNLRVPRTLKGAGIVFLEMESPEGRTSVGQVYF